MDIGFCNSCGEFEGRCECGERRVILRAEDRRRVSKFLSGLLRHSCGSFGIEVDEYGWANLNEVLEVLGKKFGIGKRELELIVKFDPKERFELKNGKIRAKYGHSINVKTDWSENGEVPEKLYHATSLENLASILSRGLLPMRRKEVHMTANPEEAIEVGKRHSKSPVLLEIEAKKMIEAGIKVRRKGKVFTADFVPPQFIILK